MVADSEPAESGSYRRPAIPTVKASSIHTLGRKGLGNINAKYPLSSLKKASPKNADENNGSSGNTGEVVSGSQSSENVSNQNQENNTSDGQGKSTNFNALVSKFGGNGKQPTAGGVTGSGAHESKPSGGDDTAVAAPQSRLSDKFSSRPTDGNGEAQSNPSAENVTNNEASPKSSSPSKGKKIPSFLNRSKPKQSELPAPQSKHTEENETDLSNPVEKTNKSNGFSLKNNPFVKQQSKQQTQPRQSPSEAKPQPRRPPQTKTQLPSQPPSRQRSPKYSNTTKGTSAPVTQKRNMVQPKSHQRLVLEQVAAQYFLTDKPNNARYVGVTDYGSGDSSNLNTSMNGLGNIDENFPDSASRGSSGTPLGLNDKCTTKDREAVILFLEGITRNDGDDPYSSIDAKNLSIITEASHSTASTRKSDEEQSQDIQRETNIDRILEMASDHLSLGKNDLALQAYRRAMKVAFADVLSVKQKLVEVKKKQAQGNLDSSTTDLTKQQEQEFELSLLQVASRVADVHNNMGVVHEMNRAYEKARSSYVDALEVYHNTCKRFEEKGDPDVDRTKKNVERMALACISEKERKALHEQAARISRRVGQEKHFSKRKTLLNHAIATLRKALDLEGKTIGPTHPVAASTLIQIGKYHYEMREYDFAVLEIRQAITILRNALGGYHPQVGKSTLLLASIYERHGLQISPEGANKDDSELELYVDALEPLKATLGEQHSEVGLLYSKIGYLYGKKGDLNLSLLAYKASLKAYGEPSSAAVTGGLHPEVVSIWLRVTEHLTSLKSWDEVVIAGHRALFLLRRSKNTLYPDAQLSCNSMASMPVSSGASVTSQLPGPAVKSSKKSQIQITSDNYYDALFATLQSLGQAQTSLSNYPLARDACSESLHLAWEMALSSRGKNEALASSVLQVIRALKRLGKAHLLEKHYTLALECFLPSLELLRSSKEMDSTLDCASVLGSLGFLYLKLKKFTESSNFLRACLTLYQKNGVAQNDRETRKIQAWLQMAESREEEIGATPPSFLEIPTIVFHGE